MKTEEYKPKRFDVVTSLNYADSCGNVWAYAVVTETFEEDCWIITDTGKRVLEDINKLKPVLTASNEIIRSKWIP